MKINIFSILKQMFSGNSGRDKTTVNQATQSSYRSDDKMYQRDPCDLLLIAGESSLILTSDRRLGGLWNFIDFDPCSSSTSDSLTEMKKLLNDNLEEAYDAVLCPFCEDNTFLLNMDDSINRSACDEDSMYYKQIIDNELDVFYPIIKMFVEKNALSKKVGIMIFYGGGTGIGLNHLAELLTNDGFYCFIEGTKAPFIKKEYLSESLARKAKGEYEEFDNSPYTNSQMTVKEYFDKIEVEQNSAMKERLRERMQHSSQQNKVATMNNMLLSAVIGDIGGEPYEFGERTKNYDAVNLLQPQNTYTDDTVCTFACADALLHDLDMAMTLRKRCRADFNRGFGGMFARWLIAKDVQPPYNSFGNGSGMRVSAAGFMAKSVHECIKLATRTALPTHNHPEGIKGAVATALAIFYGMQGHDKDFIRNHVLNEYYPDWSNLTYEAIKPDYEFDETCQHTIPAALICFLESKNYVDCLKLAIALGGDADTLAAIAGPMAYAFYREIPIELVENAKSKLPEWMLEVNEEFDIFVKEHNKEEGSMTVDLFDLERFVKAQDAHDSYNIALREIKAGKKRSHWMWYIYPQIKGLGHSSTSQKYSIKSLLEAKAYLKHETLGKHLYETVNALPENGNAEDIFGGLDAMKLRSCLTLFDIVSPNDVFARVLEMYFNGERCKKTLNIVASELTHEKGKNAICINDTEKPSARVFNGVVRPIFTSDAISSLKADEVFVFGSNLHGRHSGGAARAAMKFGAIWGQGAGLQGQSYAIPTMQGGVETIRPYVDQFIDFAKEHTDLFFYVTRIGCGIAGFKDSDIAPLFKDAMDVDNICLPESFVNILKDYKCSDMPHAPKSYKMMMYGQCRTFADIIKTLNEQHHYHSFEDLLPDFGAVIEEYQQRGAVSQDSLDVMENVLLSNREELFEGNRFHVGRFIEKLEASFDDREKSEIDRIFANRQRTKLLILLKTLNDICHYTDVEDLRYHLLSVATGRWNCGDNSYMNDPLPRIGNWPVNWFLSGLQEQWNNVTVNGELDNQLLEQVMFTNHTNNVKEMGIEQVIANDFTADGPCHPEVFYPNNPGTAPVYVKDDFSRRYIKACGEGKGPRSGHELYEMQLVKSVLMQEVSKGNYELLGERYYIPVGTIKKPVFIEYFGRVHFASLDEKRKFISDVRQKAKGC